MCTLRRARSTVSPYRVQNDREVALMALPVRRREQTTSRPPAAWEPFREFEELQRRTAELMEPVWSGVGGATLDDGVLTVRVPKPEQPRPRRVEVQPANTT